MLQAGLGHARRQRRRENVFQIIRPVAVLGAQEFVGDLAQRLRQRAATSARSAGPLADDGAHRVDALVDQRERNAREVRRVLDQPAQAVGDAANGGKPKVAASPLMSCAARNRSSWVFS